MSTDAINPASFVLVPKEATDAMRSAGGHVNSEWLNDNAPIHESRYAAPMSGVYRSMIAAAPPPPKEVLTELDLVGIICATQRDDDLTKARAIERAVLEALGANTTDAVRPDWMTCETRRPRVCNSLRENAKEMRASEKRCRGAFRQEYMGAPTRYVADAYGEAAAVFEARLKVVESAGMKGNAS